jgi:hypothetical protein
MEIDTFNDAWYAIFRPTLYWRERTDMDEYNEHVNSLLDYWKVFSPWCELDFINKQVNI